jgi:hypothetical protein
MIAEKRPKVKSGFKKKRKSRDEKRENGYETFPPEVLTKAGGRPHNERV